jgi:hypothetical protein
VTKAAIAAAPIPALTASSLTSYVPSPSRFEGFFDEVFFSFPALEINKAREGL